MRAFSRLSLLWKILLSTSVTVTLLFAITGWIVQRHAISTAARSLNDEVRASYQAYQSLWKARAEMLASVSLILSSMSDVRAAFGTRDAATIRDTAGELWSRISDENALFLVTDPEGKIVASLGGLPVPAPGREWNVVRMAARQFPRQVSGFLLDGGQLFQVVVTPVYVGSPRGPVLLNVLVAGYVVSTIVARQLKEATGGSDFVFLSGGRTIASTIGPRAAAELTKEYAPLKTPLTGIDGEPVGELWILRSSEGARQRLAALRRDMILMWLMAILAGLGVSYLLARRIVEPLVRQERMATIGRLSTSIVHDLRNPLAAIYGGAEMLVDSDLPPAQVKRLSASIYRASRRIQELLHDLTNVSRGKTHMAELCRLEDVIEAAREATAPAAEAQGVAMEFDVPVGLELPLERARMERVFTNLIANALEAMPQGGRVHVWATAAEGSVIVEVADTGPGIPPEIRERLFQPFVTGKKGGLGLGLALSRQTVLDHGGDMWAESGTGSGARFRMRLPADRALTLARR